MRARAPTAWWVHPQRGTIIQVQAHVLTLLDDPRRFGLSLHDLRRVGLDASSRQAINHLSTDPASPRMRLIARAVAKGWVRVRLVAGRFTLIQVAGGDPGRAADTCRLLAARGVRLAQGLRIIDPERGIDRRVPLPKVTHALSDSCQLGDQDPDRTHEVGGRLPASAPAMPDRPATSKPMNTRMPMSVQKMLADLAYVGKVPGFDDQCIYRSGPVFFVFHFDEQRGDGGFSAVKSSVVRSVWKTCSGQRGLRFDAAPRTNKARMTTSDWRGAIMVLLTLRGARHAGVDKGILVDVLLYDPARL